MFYVVPINRQMDAPTDHPHFARLAEAKLKAEAWAAADGTDRIIVEVSTVWTTQTLDKAIGPIDTTVPYGWDARR